MKEVGKLKKSAGKKAKGKSSYLGGDPVVGASSSALKPAPKAPGASSEAKSAKKPEIPAILLEGDASAPAQATGPGQRYVLGESSDIPDPQQQAKGLPDAYGTQRLTLIPRDPHWLYANWDLTREQQLKHNRQSADGHLVLRVFEKDLKGSPVQEIHVHPESRNWFVHTGTGGGCYLGVLGYYKKPGEWKSISTSTVVRTPHDNISDDTSFRVETLPMDVGFHRLLELVKDTAKTNLPLMEVLDELREAGHIELPSRQGVTQGEWTDAQEHALAEVVSMDLVKRIWVGSLEITELVGRQWKQEMSSMAAAEFSLPSSWSGGVSSFSSQREGTKSFWFNVNAELVIYGATEPDAAVTIGGRKIQLRDDGTFSFRFALPDGDYHLPAVAVSADGDDSRAAELRFSRSTEYMGEVGHHPQAPDLKPPKAEHL